MRLGVQAALVGGELLPGDVELDGDRIVAVGLASPEGRGIAVPGFIDLQVNGFGGVDFLDADSEGYARAGDALLETGVTGYLPTLITSSEEHLVAALGEVPPKSKGPRILGVHVEGPFLSPACPGTHPPELLRDPDPELLVRLLEAGPVRIVTLAPELPGAFDLIELLHERGVVVSFGHSDATGEEAHAAFDRGVHTVTHLFNAMRPFRHRDPGIVGAALTRPDVVVQIIVDGVHLAPDTVRLVWEAAAGRVALVTDAVAPAGAGAGEFTLGDVSLVVSDGAVRRDDGVLAGSVLTMIEAVRNLHELGVPVERALEAATLVPASVLALSDSGRIEVGRRADLLVLDGDLEIERVLVGGETLVAV
ncbi:MAG: N-acetylglucosamine-6-phosphate deacetylase [Gaiellaceae bacterium]